jgi:FkbM family methyltransferase
MQLPGRYLIANLLGRAMSLGSKEVKGQIGDYVYQFDLSDTLQRQMYFGLYDQAEIALMCSILSPGDVFFDIGANVGYYSLVASQIVGASGQIHAFEPIPDNVTRLRSAVQRNEVKNVTINQMAVGESEGVLDLYIGNESLGNSGWASVVFSGRRPDVVTVPQATMDNYISEHGIKSIRLVKLDIEGAEPEAICGMRSVLKSSNAPDILCEVNPWLLERRGLDSRAITLPLAEHGYRLFSVNRSGQEELDPSSLVTSLTNFYGYK